MELGLVVREQDGWAVLSVSGEIDMATAPHLRERMHGLLADQTRQLVVECLPVEFLLEPSGRLAHSGIGQRLPSFPQCR